MCNTTSLTLSLNRSMPCSIHFGRSRPFQNVHQCAELINKDHLVQRGMNQKSNYELLGVKPGCSEQEIKKAYIQLAKVYHPDKMQPDGEKPTGQQRNFIGIHDAYQQATKDARSRQKQHAKNFHNYMTYVNNILDIFHDNSSESASKFDEHRFKNQHVTIEKTCNKIMNVLNRSKKESESESTPKSSYNNAFINGKGLNKEDWKQLNCSKLEDYIPNEKEFKRIIRKKKKVFTIYEKKEVE